MPRARILFSSIDSTWGGLAAQMTELAAGLRDTEFEPVVLTTRMGGGTLADHTRELGVRTHVLPHRFMRRKFPFLDYYSIGRLYVRALVQRDRIALVHTHDPRSGLAIMPAAAGLRLPLVWHVHDHDLDWVTARTLPLQNRLSSTVVAISDATARWAISRGVDPAHVRRIYNGVHLAPFTPDARARARETLGIADDEIAVALVGRLHARKGQDDLIRAASNPALAGLRMRFFLFGRPERGDERYERELRGVATKLNVEQQVVFAGHRSDVLALLPGFDISAVPARREAFGRVVIEGMHAANPVVVYDDGALPELVRHGEEGFVVPPGNVRALAGALATLARDPALRARLGSAARERARRFTHEAWIAEITALYREMLTRR